MDNTTTETSEPHDGDKDQCGALSLVAESAFAREFSVDWRDYDDLLAGSSMGDDQKAEFVETLWSIAVSFVDLSLGLHPAQLATGDHDIEQVMQALLDDWVKEEDAHE